jgi:hypothetical protein
MKSNRDISQMAAEDLLTNHKRLRRELLQQPELQTVRVAVLGGELPMK